MNCPEVREYLFAFLDNELGAPLSIELQRHIERCPECAREVEIERTVRKALVSRLAACGLGPEAWGLRLETGQNTAPLERDILPPVLASGTGRKEGFSLSRLSWRAVAVTTLAAAVLIAVIAWQWPRTIGPRNHGPRENGDRPTASHFADWVVADFQHFIHDGLEVQFASDDPAEVSNWLLDRTGLAVSMPAVADPHGRLIGARKCKIDNRPAAFAMYRIDGVPASLVVARGEGLDLDRMQRFRSGGETHWVDHCRGHTVIACRRNDLSYTAVSTLPREELLGLMTDASYESN